MDNNNLMGKLAQFGILIPTLLKYTGIHMCNSHKLYSIEKVRKLESDTSESISYEITYEIPYKITSEVIFQRLFYTKFHTK